MKEPVSNRPPAPRRSACADAALQAEIRRVEKMTIEERVRAALEMGKGFPIADRMEKPSVPDGCDE